MKQETKFPERHDPEKRVVKLYRSGFSKLELSQYFGVKQSTIIDILQSHGYAYPNNRNKYASYRIDTRGYEHWYSLGSETRTNTAVHQLLAVANGEDPYKVYSNGEYHVHHKNGIPWDNRPDNIEVLPAGEHMKHHYKEREKRGTEPKGEVKYTKEEMLEWLRLFEEELGIVPTAQDISGWPGPTSETYRYRFGSFQTAVCEAGLEPRGVVKQ